MRAPRFVFVPVSGPGGAGEYHRSLAIARGLEQRWPDARIRFVLNRHAPYAASVPYPGLQLDDSPTRSSAAVERYLRQERADVVIFDSSGRLAQYRAACAAGSRVVYVSSRPKTRWKGFRLRRMRTLDQHWIAQPRFFGGEPNAYERLKLRLMGRPEIVILDTLHEPIVAAEVQKLQQQLGLEPGRYVVLCPGGGGTFEPGSDPARVFVDAAALLAATRTEPVVVVVSPRMHAELAGQAWPASLKILPHQPNGRLLGLLREAAVAAVNGGSLLLQTLAQGVPLVAAPIAGDQAARIDACAKRGAVVAAPLDATALSAAVAALLDDPAAGATLRAAAAQLTLRNGVDTATDAVARLLGPECLPATEQAADVQAPVRVLHFVTGGFSGGATQVAIALVNAARLGTRMTPLLVLRRKRHTPAARIDELRRDGVPMRLVAGWSHSATILGLLRICREFKPDILVAHGFSEHLWGRYAGLLARVPHLVQVEHNTRERYGRWRLMQSRWLATRTDRIVGCSEGVRQALVAQGLPEQRMQVIPNGIRIQPFAGSAEFPLPARAPGIVMVARLSKQKDHATLLRALALLASRGLRPKLHLAGGGKAAFRKKLQLLAQSLGIDAQVNFLGVIRDVPALLMANQITVLSTHYEGMPLALIEGMAAGCAVIGTDVPGVREVIADGVDGRLVRESDPVAMADALQMLLEAPAYASALAQKGREKALTQFSRERMNQDYEDLFMRLAGHGD